MTVVSRCGRCGDGDGLRHDQEAMLVARRSSIPIRDVMDMPCNLVHIMAGALIDAAVGDTLWEGIDVARLGRSLHKWRSERAEDCHCAADAKAIADLYMADLAFA